MSIETIAAISFLILLTLFLILKRKNLVLHKILFPFLYFAMYKTKLGLTLMDRLARYKKTIRTLGIIGIAIGYIGMIAISVVLVKNIIDVFMKPQVAQGVALVLPFQVKGAFYVPFFYWIISIFIIATVHEFSHGVVARAYGMKIKSSGFAFLGILVPVIPAAFVEPDEKELQKRPIKEQLSVFAAGPFSNILLAFIVLGIFAFFLAPAAGNMIEEKGVEITGFVDGINAAQDAGITQGEIIETIEGIKITSIENITLSLEDKKPNQMIELTTDKDSYDIRLGTNPENSSKPYLGTYLRAKTDIKPGLKEKYGFLPNLFIWLLGLVYWLYVLNLGIGLFNLVPLGPIDGGRMLQVTLHKYIKDKDKADKIWKNIGLFFLALILISIGFGFFG